MADSFIWVGIILCISQSAIFSGLNLAFFSLNKMRLIIEAEQGNERAEKILALREDSNFLLTTILWGNVAINVLLTLLSNSVMFGLTAFLFSTFAITFFGEITPQAYFSRNALRMASMLSPVVRFYQFLFFPVAKPCAKLLDAWLGKEGIDYIKEKDLTAIIRAHIEAETAEVDTVEGLGAINFLALDDLDVSKVGEELQADSIIALPSKVDFPVIPNIERSVSDPFLQKVDLSGQSWVVLTNDKGQPLMVLDANGLLRDAVFETDKPFDPYNYCHRPIIARDTSIPLGDLIYKLECTKSSEEAGVTDHDVILVWGSVKRIITGSDIMDKLLHGIAPQKRHKS